MLPSNPNTLMMEWRDSEMRPVGLNAAWKMSTIVFIIDRFIYPEPDFPDQSQDLAPFLP